MKAEGVEDLVRLGTAVLMVVILVVVVSVAFAVGQTRPGGQAKPEGKAGQFPAPPAGARVWRSQTTGKEYRVWIENERVHAEWDNIPPEIARRGAYIRTECRHVGESWIGTSQSYLPCDTTENGKRVTNWCRVVTKTEFDHIGANRMTGRSEGLRRFDCAGCRVLETVWKDFEWVPKEQSAVGSKQ